MADGRIKICQSTGRRLRKPNGRISICDADCNIGLPCTYCTGTPKKTFAIVMSGVTDCQHDCDCVGYAGDGIYWVHRWQSLNLQSSFSVTQSDTNPCVWDNDNVGTVDWSWVRYYYVAGPSWPEEGCDSEDIVYVDQQDFEDPIKAALSKDSSNWHLNLYAEHESGQWWDVFSSSGPPEATCTPTAGFANTLTDCLVRVCSGSPGWNWVIEAAKNGGATVT